jgi:hypothetical protein
MTTGSPAAPAAPRLEPLALASLLTALVLGWCPLTAFAAIGLGVAAIGRITREPGIRTGRGLAVAGIAVATGILILEAWALGRLQQEIQAAMDAQSVASVEAALTPLPMKAAEWDARSTAPTDGAQAAFARAAADRLGTLKDVSITHRTAEGLTEPVIGVTFNVSGERANGFGHATFATQPGTLPPRLLLRSIELEVGGERRRLPEQVAEATPADPATAEQEEAK